MAINKSKINVLATDRIFESDGTIKTAIVNNNKKIRSEDFILSDFY
jgi:hypothetical protein